MLCDLAHASAIKTVLGIVLMPRNEHSQTDTHRTEPIQWKPLNVQTLFINGTGSLLSLSGEMLGTTDHGRLAKNLFHRQNYAEFIYPWCMLLLFFLAACFISLA